VKRLLRVWTVKQWMTTFCEYVDTLGWIYWVLEWLKLHEVS